ncbi:MAG: epoxyqueuosine reductase, partial [Maritimibacter sp.]
FSGSPIKRVGRARFLRNVCYAIGNSGDATLIPVLEPLVADADPVLAEAAQWALARLG